MPGITFKPTTICDAVGRQIATNNVLASLILDVRPELVVRLFEKLQEALGGNHSGWGRCDDILMFLAELARIPGHSVLGRWAAPDRVRNVWTGRDCQAHTLSSF